VKAILWDWIVGGQLGAIFTVRKCLQD